MTETSVKTELLIHPRSPKRWEVVRRPDVEPTVAIEQKDIKLLCTFTRKDLAVAFAEGVQSQTAEPIRMSV